MDAVCLLGSRGWDGGAVGAEQNVKNERQGSVDGSAFARFLDQTLGPLAEALGSRKLMVLNSVEVLSWGLDRRHLLDLMDSGKVKVVKTRFLSENFGVRGLDYLRQTAKDVSGEHGRAVRVRWSVGGGTWGGGYVISDPINIKRQDLEDVQRALDLDFERNGDQDAKKGIIMAQEILQSMKSQGVFSLVYIGGQLSHAALQRPKNADSRSEYYEIDEEGAENIEERALPQGARKSGDFIAGYLDKRFGHGKVAYMRVDGVAEDDQSFAIIGVEVIDPELWLTKGDAGERVGMFARHVVQGRG